MKRQRDTTAHKMAVLNYHIEQLKTNILIEMKKLFKFLGKVGKLVLALITLVCIGVCVIAGAVLTPFYIAWETAGRNSDAIYKWTENLSKKKGDQPND